MTTTSAFVSTVNESRTIKLPEGIPVGAEVAVVVLPPKDDALRDIRFRHVMDAIRAAINGDFMPPSVSDHELSQLIKEARQAAISAPA